jgi:hypothetical protein
MVEPCFFTESGLANAKALVPQKKERETKMTKRNLWLVSLLVVFGLGVMAPVALAQAPAEPEGTVLNVGSTFYTMRPNSNGDALGPTFLNYASGYGTIAGGEAFTFTFNKPIAGAATINKLASTADGLATLLLDMCDDSNSSIAGLFCVNTVVSISATSNSITFTNGSAPITGWLSGYITFWGLRAPTVGVPAGTFITDTVSAAVNHSYPITFGNTSAIQAAPVNVGQVANVPPGGTVSASMAATNVLSCVGAAPVSPTPFFITVTELWAGAWTALSDEMVLAPFAPTSTDNPSNGSDISVTLTGIPIGVTITPVAPAVPDDCVTCSETWGTFSPTSFTAAAGSTTVTFDFPLATTLLSEVESAIIEFDITTSGPLPPNTPPVVAAVYLNPMTPAPGDVPAFTYPVGTLPAESASPFNAITFIGCQTTLLFPYVTNYVAGAAAGPTGNWDTAISIANTTSDPFTYAANTVLWPNPTTPILGGATPQTGSCTIYVYSSGFVTGIGVAGATVPAAVEATPSYTFPTTVVPSGGIWASMLSNTPAKGTTGGYAIAVCNFQNAVGYVETVDNAGIGAWQILGSYLALVIPNPFYEPRSYDGVLGEFSFSQWWASCASEVPIFICDGGSALVKKAKSSLKNRK